MNFFGGRSRKDESSSDQIAPEKTDVMAGESYDSSPPTNFAAGGDGGITNSASPEALQRLVMQEQQKALVHQVVAKLTEVSFDLCVDKPEAALTTRQRACVHTIVGKYLDTSEFVVGRALKGRQP
ncbi:hypothetical protein CTAYLR_000454 [Chrysophaeum taylorii]|uniref:Mitochondrial import inner membrane translocase subunit n=1 Tax=Chrysophaeum taylorii TaxID=2483200 RepID=A0AAD7XMY4_9STRA|nr:hypothetical protein CTAYLR_000454 [Chrysophaeum taylorii]